MALVRASILACEVGNYVYCSNLVLLSLNVRCCTQNLESEPRSGVNQVCGPECCKGRREVALPSQLGYLNITCEIHPRPYNALDVTFYGCKILGC